MTDGFYNHRLAFNVGIPPRFQDIFLEDVVPRNEEQKEYIQCIKNVLNKKDWSLVCLGTVGNGKSMIACAGLNSYINWFPRDGRYITQERLVDMIKDSYNSKDTSETRIVNALSTIPILVIDEVTTRRWTDNAKVIVEKIISQRYDHKKGTILIGNLDADTFKEMFDEHIRSRLRTGNTIVMTAPDMRVREEV